FLFLLGDIARDAENTRGFSFDDEWRIVDARVSQASIVSDVTHFVGLWRAGESGRKFLTHVFAIGFVDHVQQLAADEIGAFKTQPPQGCRVAPLEPAERIDS